MEKTPKVAPNYSGKIKHKLKKTKRHRAKLNCLMLKMLKVCYNPTVDIK